MSPASYRAAPPRVGFANGTPSAPMRQTGYPAAELATRPRSQRVANHLDGSVPRPGPSTTNVTGVAFAVMRPHLRGCDARRMRYPDGGGLTAWTGLPNGRGR